MKSSPAASPFPITAAGECGLGGAVSCPAHEGMHLRENHIIAEIVDWPGTACPRGNTGSWSSVPWGLRAMPLLRYRTGDYTRFLPPCPCGGVTRRIDRVSRRGEGPSMEKLDEACSASPAWWTAVQNLTGIENQRPGAGAGAGRGDREGRLRLLPRPCR